MGNVNVFERAVGYGMPGEQFNGFDPVQTYEVVNRAMQRARKGEGPSLVEGMCYRYLSHSTDDDDRTYRTREEIEKERLSDPVPGFERVLINAGVMNAGQVEQLKKDVLRETNEATDEAEAMPFPVPSDLYTHLYEGAWEPWQ